MFIVFHEDPFYCSFLNSLKLRKSSWEDWTPHLGPRRSAEILLTVVLYRISLCLLFLMKLQVLLVSPSLDLALLIRLSHCFCQDNVGTTRTPRSFSTDTYSRSNIPSRYIKSLDLSRLRGTLTMYGICQGGNSSC